MVARGGLELSRKLVKQVLSQASYPPTVTTAMNSKASEAVREPRNAPICPFRLNPGIEACSGSAGFGGEMESSIRGRRVQTS
jgi:hypothetical protein